jgi:ureidoglycolate dehydrogenase (NAD+)
MPKDKFTEDVDNFLSQIKTTPPLPGYEKVIIPGEIEYTPVKERKSNGIPVTDDTWSSLTEMAEEANININEML